MNQPTLFDLEAFTLLPVSPPIYDPAWDEIETVPELVQSVREHLPTIETIGFTTAQKIDPPTPVHDPYWDEVDIAPQHPQPEDRWNPSHFGEVPHKLDPDGQLTIFSDDSDEPPDPDDYKNLNDYHCAWAEWRTRVGAQVSSDTVSTTVEPRVGAQVALHTKKVAPQHDTHWVEKYWVERSGNKYWYYRYCWMVSRKKNRIYLGSVDSNLARRKKEAVEISILNGRKPQEIEELIHSWHGQLSQERCAFRPASLSHF